MKAFQFIIILLLYFQAPLIAQSNQLLEGKIDSLTRIGERYQQQIDSIRVYKNAITKEINLLQKRLHDDLIQTSGVRGITTIKANLYQRESFTSPILKKVPANTKITVTDNAQFPFKMVKYGKYTGYMNQSLISFDLSEQRQRTKTRSNIYSSPSTSKPSYQRRHYIRGPRGGCYYINSNGNKTYVDRSLCN